MSDDASAVTFAPSPLRDILTERFLEMTTILGLMSGGRVAIREITLTHEAAEALGLPPRAVLVLTVAGPVRVRFEEKE